MRLYVSNIDYSATESDVREVFRDAGYIAEEVKLMRDQSDGRSRGFAFVELAANADGQAAIKDLDGEELMGRRLNVQQAHPRSEKHGRRDDGGRRGRDRGRRRDR